MPRVFITESIGWTHQSREEVSVDEYEQTRQNEKKVKKLDTCTRIELLNTECETSLSEILRASQASALIRQQRIRTMRKSKSSERVEEMVESARKSLKRVLSSKSKISGMKMATSSNQESRTNDSWDLSNKKVKDGREVLD